MANTPFKMKGNPMQRNFGIGSPARATDPTSGTTDKKKTKSKDPIGDWLRKAGSKVKGDIEKVIGGTRKVAETVKGNVRSAIGQAGTDLGNIKKSVEHKAQKVTGDIEKGVRSVVSKLPKSKKSETHKKVLKNKFNPSAGWKWVKK